MDTSLYPPSRQRNVFRSIFRVGGETPYEQLTRGGDARIDLWCSDHSDLLAVTGEPGVTDTVEETVGVRDTLVDGDQRLVITEDCLMDHRGDTVESYLTANDCLLLPPLRYERGRKRIRVLTPDPPDLARLYRDLADPYEVTVESKARVSEVVDDASPLFGAGVSPSLSSRQREVFTAAYERGYYEVPREATTAEIAGEVGVQRRTAEHHLREAERKIAETMIDFV